VCGRAVRDNYLVTEAIHPACSVQQYVVEHLPRLPEDVRQTMRRGLIEGLARFVAAIHRAGIIHNDFHVGNVLLLPDRLDRVPQAPGFRGQGSGIRGQEPGARGQGSGAGTVPNSTVNPTPLASQLPTIHFPKLYLIDLPGVRFSGPLKWPASRASLIMFGAGWWERMSPRERLRFWRTYLLERPDLNVPERRAAARELERGSREYCRRVARRRDKRAMRTNRDYFALRGRRGEAHGVADLPQAELSRLMEAPEALLERNLRRPVKLGHSKLIVEAELPLASGPVHVAYARYRPRNRWKAFLGLFRRGRALRGWFFGHALLARQIATARPIAFCQARRSWLGRESYLATEWVEGAENLHLYGRRLAALSPSRRLRMAARCAESLGKLIGRMHACQVAHNDLKAANLLVVQRGDDVQTHLIDAEDARIARRLTSARRARDLSRLAASMAAHPWVTKTILCRFLQAYARQFGPAVPDWKPLWRQIARRSRRIIRRKRRRGRELL
jgi:tRNA A-37 threonylcarbamoyl transferase component Bud32